MFLVLPYFNEPDVLRTMPDLHMSDFRLEYDNHEKYTSGEWPQSGSLPATHGPRILQR